MKKFFALMLVFFILTSFKKFSVIQSPKYLFTADTVKQAHIIDGIITEWPADKFTADKETEISYAVDNDASQLYVALKIPNQRTQLRLMRMGMNVFIDIKGKHKEGTMIEFPLKSSPLDAAGGQGGGFGGGRQRDENGGGEGNRPDFQKMRQQFAPRLFAMKISGFEEQQDEMTLGLTNENGINIAFTWDEANVMYIEYGIPIKSIGTVANLNGKKISVGLRLNAPASATIASTSSQVVAVPSTIGARGGIARPMTSSKSNDGGNTQNSMQEINIWTKYDMKF